MSKKTNKGNINKTNKVEEQDITNDTVYVRVIRNFNDATDSERFISAGPNSYYKTDKKRANMLAKAGYVEFDCESTVVNTNVDSEDINIESNINANDDTNTVITNDEVDNSNDITNDNVNEDDNTSDEDDANDDSEDTSIEDNTNANDDNNTDNEENPNE